MEVTGSNLTGIMGRVGRGGDLLKKKIENYKLYFNILFWGKKKELQDQLTFFKNPAPNALVTFNCPFTRSFDMAWLSSGCSAFILKTSCSRIKKTRLFNFMLKLLPMHFKSITVLIVLNIQKIEIAPHQH
jgi:hypothetical protein